MVLSWWYHLTQGSPITSWMLPMVLHLLMSSLTVAFCAILQNSSGLFNLTFYPLAQMYKWQIRITHELKTQFNWALNLPLFTDDPFFNFSKFKQFLSSVKKMLALSMIASWCTKQHNYTNLWIDSHYCVAVDVFGIPRAFQEKTLIRHQEVWLKQIRINILSLQWNPINLITKRP